MKYHTVVNEVTALQRAYAVHALVRVSVCMCVRSHCLSRGLFVRRLR